MWNLYYSGRALALFCWEEAAAGTCGAKVGMVRVEENDFLGGTARRRPGVGVRQVQSREGMVDGVLGDLGDSVVSSALEHDCLYVVYFGCRIDTQLVWMVSQGWGP